MIFNRILKNKSYILYHLLIISFPLSCQSKIKLTPGEGFVKVTGGKIWYKIIGQGDKTPLVLLHGGPGFPSHYLNPLSELSNDRPVIFFDQLGCGRSDHAIDTSLMTIESYVKQLEQLRAALSLENFYLYGSSWGSMLGTDYYLKYPQRVKALILSSPCLSAKMWTHDADTLIATLPDSIQLAIRNEPHNSAEYQEATSVYYKNFVTRTPSPDIDSSGKNMNLDVYLFMWGPEEFIATGTLKNYDRTDRLHEIKIPTLFITGEFDEARPSTVKYYQSLVPGAKFALMKNAGHLTMQDNPSQDIQAIYNFLQDLERK